MDTMTWTKIIGASCGSLLILLLIQWVAEEVYHHSHYKYKEVAYLLEIDEDVTQPNQEEEKEIPFMELLVNSDLSKGKKVFGKCKACHKLGDGENGTFNAEDWIEKKELKKSIQAEESRGVHGPQRGPISITQITEKGQV